MPDELQGQLKKEKVRLGPEALGARVDVADEASAAALAAGVSAATVIASPSIAAPSP